MADADVPAEGIGTHVLAALRTSHAPIVLVLDHVRVKRLPGGQLRAADVAEDWSVLQRK